MASFKVPGTASNPNLILVDSALDGGNLKSTVGLPFIYN